MKNYSYNQYLEKWTDYFGDDNQGEFVYWAKGRCLSRTLPKMGKAEFENTLAKFDALSPQIDELQRRVDYGNSLAIDNQVDNLMAESFECELPLFF